MRKNLMMAAGVALLVGVVSIWAIHHQEDLRATAIASGQPTTMPSGAVDLGNGRYIKYVQRDGQAYAGVVFDMKCESDVYKSRPGFYRDHARGLLAANDKRTRWVDERQEEKDGRMVIIFRLMTQEEQRLADEVGQEMSQPLEPEGMK